MTNKKLVTLFITIAIASSLSSANELIKGKSAKLEVTFSAPTPDGSTPSLSQAKKAVGVGACIADIIELTMGAALAIGDEQAGDKNYYTSRMFNAIAFGLTQNAGTNKHSLKTILETGGVYECAKFEAESACEQYGLEVSYENRIRTRTHHQLIQRGTQVLSLDTTNFMFKGQGAVVYAKVICGNAE